MFPKLKFYQLPIILVSISFIFFVFNFSSVPISKMVGSDLGFVEEKKNMKENTFGRG